ncbi:MAG: UDP-4-amino-4,6-dideoxy-N-acetyl-beta-L-altrosamine transaminase [Bacteroidetes bacterium]|nr:UDP-4-amino-4,6-dideoxy-N-acetyl-beta-L-altrosamine transaminase [Bacteroidota bacterium]
MSTNKTYSYGKQTIEEDDIQAVVNVLKGDWLTQGPYVKEFEESLGKKFNAKYVSAVANGTAGLHLIALALGWKQGDIVLTTPITFLASANCILYANATPDFVDINPQTYTIDIVRLEEKIKNYLSRGKNIKAVVAVDFAGLPCDWENLRRLADVYNFQLVNDNCHALGAEYNGDIGYATKYADIVNMSFHPVKHITTGEGGAILTNDALLDKKIKILRTHGITKDEELLTKNDGPWYYEMQHLGFNYRITDFQCALGTSQLKKLDGFVNKRNEIAKFYDESFKEDNRFIIPSVQGNIRHAYHLYPLQIKFENIDIAKKLLFQIMKNNGIGLQVHYIPVHLQPFYKENYGFKIGDYPISEKFYEREISIPIYPGLNQEDIIYIAKKVQEIVK